MDNTVRIGLGRLTMSVLLSLVLPMLVVVLIDYNLGLMPWLTLIASIILIPVSSFIVIRATVAEFERVVQVVAPPEVDSSRDEDILEPLEV